LQGIPICTTANSFVFIPGDQLGGNVYCGAYLNDVLTPALGAAMMTQGGTVRRELFIFTTEAAYCYH
jgi:hypothetical protein